MYQTCMGTLFNNYCVQSRVSNSAYIVPGCPQCYNDSDTEFNHCSLSRARQYISRVLFCVPRTPGGAYCDGEGRSDRVVISPRVVCTCLKCLYPPFTPGLCNKTRHWFHQPCPVRRNDIPHPPSRLDNSMYSISRRHSCGTRSKKPINHDHC